MIHPLQLILALHDSRCWAEQVKWSKTTNKEASRRGKDSGKKGDDTPWSDKGGTVERQNEAVEDEE
jgi:hypothetical protein